jgi:hypothetical protein
MAQNNVVAPRLPLATEQYDPVMFNQFINILRLYFNQLDNPAPIASSRITYTPAGTGAVDTTVQTKLRESVSVFDYMSADEITDVKARTSIYDVTHAWESAQLVADKIIIPSGLHLLNNFRPRRGKRFVGEGYYKSTIKQKLPGNYAFNCLSDATVGPEHLWGVALLDVGFVGASGATVSVLNIEANGAFSVQGSEFDIAVDGAFQAVRMWCPDAANIYNTKVTAQVNGVTGLGVRSDGAYNTYDFFITATGVGAIEDFSSGSLFKKVITENKQTYNGSDNLIQNAKVEFWAGAATAGAAITVNGTSNTLENTSIIGVPADKALIGYSFNGGGTTHNVDGVIILSVLGRVPTYAMSFDTGSIGTISNVRSQSTFGVDYLGWAILKNWTFLGDCSSITSTQRKPGQLRYEWLNPTTGSTYTVSNNIDGLLIEPIPGVIATWICNLPSDPRDGQVLRIGALSGITAITWNAGAGKTVNVNVPTTIASGGHLAMMYHAENSRWVPMA